MAGDYKQGKPIVFDYQMFRAKLFPIAVKKIFNNIKELDNGCWQWIGDIYPNQTTYLRLGTGVKISAKRASYLSFKGHIEQGLTVRNTCENKLCVNPDHLYLASTGIRYRDLERAKLLTKST